MTLSLKQNILIRKINILINTYYLYNWKRVIKLTVLLIQTLTIYFPFNITRYPNTMIYKQFVKKLIVDILLTVQTRSEPTDLL